MITVFLRKRRAKEIFSQNRQVGYYQINRYLPL